MNFTRTLTPGESLTIEAAYCPRCEAEAVPALPPAVSAALTLLDDLYRQLNRRSAWVEPQAYAEEFEAWRVVRDHLLGSASDGTEEKDPATNLPASLCNVCRTPLTYRTAPYGDVTLGICKECKAAGEDERR